MTASADSSTNRGGFEDEADLHDTVDGGDESEYTVNMIGTINSLAGVKRG